MGRETKNKGLKLSYTFVVPGPRPLDCPMSGPEHGNQGRRPEVVAIFHEASSAVPTPQLRGGTQSRMQYMFMLSLTSLPRGLLKRCKSPRDEGSIENARGEVGDRPINGDAGGGEASPVVLECAIYLIRSVIDVV